MTAEEEPSAEDLRRRSEERGKRMAELRGRLDQADAWEKAERRDRISTGFKLVAYGAAALVVLAGGVWAVSQLASLTPDNPCGFHEHASFRVADGGQLLSFQHPRFDMRNMAMRAHLHQPNDNQVHLEGRCASVSEFFGLMGMTLKPDYLKLDGELHGGRILRSDGNHTLGFYLYHDVAGNWTWEPYADLPGHQLRDKQRMLVAYGNYTDEQLTDLQARVPAVGG